MTARALAVVHTAIYDAWAAYDSLAVGTRLGAKLRQPEAERTQANKDKAVSFAAYLALVDLFPVRQEIFAQQMTDLGYVTDGSDTSSAATVGAGGSSRMDLSVSWLQIRTRLSPVAARAGSGRPTVATSPRARLRTRPMTVVSLRIYATLPQGWRPGRDAEAGIAGELEPWRGQGQGTALRRVRTCSAASKNQLDRIGDRPAKA